MSPKRRKAAGRKPARARRKATARKRRPARKRQATRKRQPPRKQPARKPARKPAPKGTTTRRARRRAATPTETVRAKPALESMVGAAPESVAAVELVKERGSYNVQRGNHLFVTVNVDAAQLGQVSLFMETTLIGRFTAPVASHDLGLADDLIGKLLIVDALVSDVSTQTNALKIRVTLTGGPAPKTLPASTEAETEGGSAQFRISVLLQE